MIVTDFTKRVLKARREIRDMKAGGYRMHVTDWEINYGDRQDERIVDVQISKDGKYVWTKLSGAMSREEGK